jgi:molybdopterin molybdotransferase
VVKEALSRHGEIEFWTVRIRPGKPMAFGVLVGKDSQGRTRRVPHIGLPGNPVSALVTFELFARPAILKMLGHSSLARPTVTAVFHGALANPDGRRTFARAVLERRADGYHASLSGGQGSHVLSALASANALVILPEDQSALREGDTVQAIVLDDALP